MKSEALKSAGVSDVITDLKQGVKNPNRVNVYVNDKYAFSLDIAQVVDLGVKKGMSVSEEQLAEFKKASEFGKLYQRALEWCLVRPRSEKETREYLYRRLKDLSENLRLGRPARRVFSDGSLNLPSEASTKFSDRSLNFSSEIIARLKTRGYLDDRKFAEYYVENRFVKKGISAKRLRMELMKKGVSKDIIEEVLLNSERDDTEEIKKMIAKKRARYDDDKLIQYLCRQGFPYDLVRELVYESSNYESSESGSMDE